MYRKIPIVVVLIAYLLRGEIDIGCSTDVHFPFLTLLSRLAIFKTRMKDETKGLLISG